MVKQYKLKEVEGKLPIQTVTKLHSRFVTVRSLHNLSSQPSIKQLEPKIVQLTISFIHSFIHSHSRFTPQNHVFSNPRVSILNPFFHLRVSDVNVLIY
ncbi:hypothetical protein QVD17_29712 [Tagetes erecta]|uniref:Uncharacterized protein n=1 Tax=Tagetes erecta TaxID=13708 RepID=A0AAD8K043_TARER|nr:hypothetical protein QVD17_29712 [Tagetes erecta]